MRRTNLLLAGLSILVLAGCGPGEVVVHAEVEVDNPEGEGTVLRPLVDLEVQLLPYDRDVVFDSLAGVASTPEPAIPAELLEAQARVASAQAEWRGAEARWQTLRDTLQALSRELQRLNRGEARYVTLFREFQTLEGQLNTVERQMNNAFREFTELQQETFQQAEEVRLIRENWADDAFAEVANIFRERARVSGLDVVVDTTDASGVARLRARPGQYWIHARHELPYDELYWNVPVEVSRGDPVEIRLNRASAQVRPRL